MPKTSNLPKPRVERLHQSVARTIGLAILRGELKPGDPLAGELDQAPAMGVSRTPYREAMRILIAKGMLESRPKAGTHVTPRSRWNMLDPDVLAWMFDSKPDESFVRDLFELRAIIEPAGARIAAGRRTDDQLHHMQISLDRMRQFGLAAEAGQEADREFHRLLLEASHNEALISLCSSIGAAVQWTTRFKQRVHINPRDPLPEHEAVFDAIAAQDGVKAEHSMQHLLELALNDMNVSMNIRR